MQYTFFGSKHRSNVQGNEENSINIASQASIVEVGNKHENGGELPDFADLFFFGIKNVRVGGKILGSVGRSETHTFIFFGLADIVSFSLNFKIRSNKLVLLITFLFSYLNFNNLICQDSFCRFFCQSSI